MVVVIFGQKQKTVVTIFGCLASFTIVHLLYHWQQDILLQRPRINKESLQEISTNLWWRVPNDECLPFFSSNFTDASNHSLQLSSKMDEFARLQADYKVSDVDRDMKDETCESYLQRRHFFRDSFSDEERQFPIAYSILVYKTYSQVEFLLRTIHRPEHSICIHVDKKSDERFVRSLQNLVSCFPSEQVFIASTRVDVQWGTFTTLQADLVCMEELWRLWHRRRWKYFINLTGQEFPLRTNLELVRILKALNGANSVDGGRNANKERWPKTKLPFPIEYMKGSAHIVITWQFVNFSLHDSKAVLIQKLMKEESSFQDELYFPTLNHNPHLGAPGSSNDTTQSNPFINRAKEWIYHVDKSRCRSERIQRAICIWSLLDLPRLTTRKELFANKFHWDFDHLGLQCLHEWYWQRTREELLSPNHSVRVNVSWFANLPMARNHQ